MFLGALWEIPKSFFNYNFVLYFVDFSRYLREEIQGLVASLLLYQTLGIVVKKDTKTDDRSNMDCLIDFLNHIDGLDESPPVETFVHWQEWCLAKIDNDYSNLDEIVSRVRKPRFGGKSRLGIKRIRSC